ncbi:MAG TPA: filamentous hemagglutinin N-terminal domain-containing protein [Allocoleopsis sp.]
MQKSLVCVVSCLVVAGAATCTECHATTAPCCTDTTALSGGYILAQIVSDTTLGNQVSVVRGNVNVQGQPADLIEGGVVRGTNLFHSFDQFNVGEGLRVYFAHPAGIETILTRVTGNNPSNIQGLLGVDGQANLFLLNPNGIIFGANARLDVRGSFVASTADALVFGNGFKFSATNPQVPPVLTINLPIGLQYGTQAGTIQVQASELQVPEEKILALLGGNVTLDNGTLLAPSGRVELGGLAGSGTVAIKGNGGHLRFLFPNDVMRADVNLTNSSLVNVRAGGGGSIAIDAHNLNLRGESKLQAGIDKGQGFIGARAGNIDIEATGITKLAEASVISSSVLENAVGIGGNIRLTTGSLSVTSGSQLSASTFGQGDAGNIAIMVADTVFLDGSFSGARSSVGLGARGNGGNINISTGSLSVTNGAALITTTAGRAGNAGNIIVTANNASLDGVGSNQASSAVRSSVATGTIGNGGNVKITTGTLSVTNGALLSASTAGQGNAGNVTISASDSVSFEGVGSNGLPSAAASQVLEDAVGKGGNIKIAAGSLSVTQGAALSTNTRGRGDAGNISLVANDTISFDGVGSSGLPSAAASQVREEAVGKGGNIRIVTRSLSVNNGAQLLVNAKGKGNGGSVTIYAADTASFQAGGGVTVSSLAAQAGNLNISANTLLMNQGRLTAETGMGQGEGGANITLDASKLLLMGNESLISAEAFRTANGGNININTGFLIVLPPEGPNGSDIIANAVEGNGGKVNITAQGIFGIQFRPNLTPLNDITASSQFGLAGVVEINSPDVDPSRGLVELPVEIVDVSKLIDQNLCTAKRGSTFTATGRGGLPASPNEVLSAEAAWEDWRMLADSQSTVETQQSVPIQPPMVPWRDRERTKDNAPTTLVEAQGWEIDANGKVVLTAQPLAATPHDTWVNPADCQRLRQKLSS